ncbi:hypothetical protein SLEP1_g55024 [Rubroshorea leprosula]|uniref:NB-ARC domain-containing protein n=1 Tax=Rubroshorea leprosula TaxID=152421 RepID=A0AAV5MH59_9ROSI|nr:hypothetical protein SLEP1_g55024 [Rubroshorea leprosula]
MGEDSIKEKTWGYLMGNEVGMIGVCGLGGVGKTTIMKNINNELVRQTKFDKLIWVTISYPLDVIKLQDNIARVIVVADRQGLPKNEVGMIGVCGLGGVGKTTIMKNINNELVRQTKFDKLIWATVSYPFDVIKLQENIARAIIVDDRQGLPKCGDKERRAAALLSIMGKVRYVLILDDVWEVFALNEVGVPEPTIQNGSKIVITSRSIDLCKRMGCEIVKVEPLSFQESLNLFLDKVGRHVLQVPNLEGILKLIVEECGGLSLAIVVIAESMKGEDDVEVWKNALNELREQVKSVIGSDQKIFEKLSTRELIEGWIGEGLIDGLPSRKATYDKGYAFLNKLVKNCLLEKTVDLEGDVFKMHDIVRDMAIKSIDPEFGHMIKAEIPKSFFEGMLELKVLDLSQTKIEVLPNSISNLEKLSSLRLKWCTRLRYLPSLAKLRVLKKLDLRGSRIEVVPQGMEKLISLEYLDLSYCYNLKEIPMGILSNLSNLQYFLVYGKLKIKRVEVVRLSKLGAFEGVLDDIQGFNYFVKSKDFQILTDYTIVVGAPFSTMMEMIDRKKHMVNINNCNLGEECIVLPDNLQNLVIDGCKNMRSSLNKAALLEKATELSYCGLRYYEDMECVVDLDLSSVQYWISLKSCTFGDCLN